MTASAAAGGAGRPARATAAWIVLALTIALLLSDYMSRQVLNAVFPALKAQWGLSDAQLGALSGVVALMVGVLAFPLSWLADRFGRVRAIVVMALAWSAATFACGLAQSYGGLLAARIAVGVGEAAYGSVGVAVVVALFPPKRRATIVGLFTAAGVFGSVVGLAMGGAVAASLGWRWAFAVMGGLGVVLAAVYALVVRTPPPTADAGRDGPVVLRSFPALVRAVFPSRSVVATYVASGLQLFVSAALMAWLPSYLNRAYAMAPARAASVAALIVLAGGIGMVAGGLLADRFGRDARRRLSIAAGYALTTAVALALAWSAPSGVVQLALLAGGMLFASASLGPVGAAVADQTRPEAHATVFATLTLANNLLGLAVGPFVVGWFADRVGLELALQLAVLPGAAAAFVFLAASRLARPLTPEPAAA